MVIRGSCLDGYKVVSINPLRYLCVTIQFDAFFIIECVTFMPKAQGICMIVLFIGIIGTHQRRRGNEDLECGIAFQ